MGIGQTRGLSLHAAGRPSWYPCLFTHCTYKQSLSGFLNRIHVYIIWKLVDVISLCRDVFLHRHGRVGVGDVRSELVVLLRAGGLGRFVVVTFFLFPVRLFWL